MKCPNCGEENRSRVVDSRDKGAWRHRRHECQACGARWNTFEMPENDMNTMIKIRELARKIGEIQ